jgi:glucose/arabinose dehydrogenase
MDIRNTDDRSNMESKRSTPNEVLKTERSHIAVRAGHFEVPGEKVRIGNRSKGVQLTAAKLSRRSKTLATLGAIVIAAGLGIAAVWVLSPTVVAHEYRQSCEKAGLTLPPGFCASIFADDLGRARHLTVAANGDVYVNTWSSTYTELKNASGGYIVGLRDSNKDGKADMIERFGTVHQDGKAGGGTGIAVHNNSLYLEDWGKVVRYPIAGGRLTPAARPTTILSGLWTEKGHIMHPFAITSTGVMYVNSGSITNSCQEQDRTPESPGIKDCPELRLHGGIWRYDAKKPNQKFSASERFATGTRNVVALAVNPADNALYATLHGRDQLNPHWPKLYTEAQNNELPGEMFSRIDRGDDFGWPFCYFDPAQNKHVLAPEYGGDGGKTQGICAQKKLPALSFPAHWAPNGMTFYNGTSFPIKYRGGAFVVFHGSHDRKPTQAGYQMAFVPFQSGGPAGTYEQFATGFSGPGPFTTPKEAPNRPMAVAIGPDGSMFVSDDVKGRIWKITYVGDK